MAIDYTRMAQVARTLIEANGREITIRKLRNTATDASKPWRGNADPDVGGAGLDPVTLDAVAVPPSSLNELGMKINTPDLVQQASRVFIAAPPETPVDLSAYDEVVDGSAVFRVIKLDELRPADTTLLYYVWVDG